MDWKYSGLNKQTDCLFFQCDFGPNHRELHYGYVVRLLNDLFGIQARGGCSCAGPYGHTLLGLTRQQSEALAAEVQRGVGCLRPGWVRFNLHWLCNDQEVDYILSAMALVAHWGAKLLASYTLDTRSGLWRAQRCPETPPSGWMSSQSCVDAGASHHRQNPNKCWRLPRTFFGRAPRKCIEGSQSMIFNRRHGPVRSSRCVGFYDPMKAAKSGGELSAVGGVNRSLQFCPDDRRLPDSEKRRPDLPVQIPGR